MVGISQDARLVSPSLHGGMFCDYDGLLVAESQVCEGLKKLAVEHAVVMLVQEIAQIQTDHDLSRGEIVAYITTAKLTVGIDSEHLSDTHISSEMVKSVMEARRLYGFTPHVKCKTRLKMAKFKRYEITFSYNLNNSGSS